MLSLCRAWKIQIILIDWDKQPLCKYEIRCQRTDVKKLAARLPLHCVCIANGTTLAYTASYLQFGISNWKEAEITLFLSHNSQTKFCCPLLL